MGYKKSRLENKPAPINPITMKNLIYFLAFPPAILVEKSFPALNLGTFLALIFMVAPVCGLRPLRAARAVTEKVPKPTKVTVSPFFKVDTTAPVNASSASFACFFVMPESLAICSINSALFILEWFVLKCYNTTSQDIIIATFVVTQIMEDLFSIDVDFGGKEYSFEARLVAIGYTHKICIVINGVEVTFEPDEERNYRAILNTSEQSSMKAVDIELIKAVGEKIQSLLQ